MNYGCRGGFIMCRVILTLWLLAFAAPVWADYTREEGPDYYDDDEPAPAWPVPKGMSARDRAASNARNKKIRERNNAAILACVAVGLGIAVALGATKMVR